MKYIHKSAGIGMVFIVCGCAHTKTENISTSEAARLNPKLVRETVIFEPGTEEGAIIPEISAPRLRAHRVPEKVENGRLVESHREWLLEGDVVILGLPQTHPKGTGGQK